MSLVTAGRAPGALYELVARGAKDKYFFQKDLPRGAATAKEVEGQKAENARLGENPFNNFYEPQAPRIPETRTQQPLNAADFGRPVEFQLETFGDILTDAVVTIDLPTWFDSLPLTAGTTADVRQSVLANDWRCTDADADGVRFGYTSGIAYYLFERIQIMQDRILLVDITGDSLQSLQLTEGTYNTAFLNDRMTGRHDGSARSVGINAAPGRLRLRLPWPCCQDKEDGGFPICAARSQNFRLRLVLRKLEDIVEGSDGHYFPNPWGANGSPRNFQATDASGITLSAQSLLRERIGKPVIQLETTQLYISPADSDALQKATLYYPFRNYEDQEYTANEPDYAPLDKGGVAPITRRLEGRHPVERILWYFREVQALQAGQRWRLRADEVYAGASLNATGQFYSGLKLIVAGQDREDSWQPAVWQDIQAYVKNDRDPGRFQSQIDWSLGTQYERELPAPRQLEGAVNFTTADRPTFLLNLLNVLHNPVNGQRKTYLQICTSQWAVLEFKDGRCRMLFAN